MSEEMESSTSSASADVSSSSSSSESVAAPVVENASAENAPIANPVAKTGIAGLQEAAKAALKGSAPVAAPAAPGTAPQPYSPNFKFKIFDKKANTHVEKEIDEWARGIVKDVETEKKVKELFEKSYSLETTKAARDRYKDETLSLRGEMKQTKQALNQLSGYVQNGDYQSFFEALKIPEDKLLKYALDRINYRELPADKRAEYDNMRNTSQRAQFLEERNRELMEAHQQTQVQARASELDRAVGDENVSRIAQAYDARVGVPGAFKREIMNRGAYHWAVNKQDIPVAQAVQEVLQLVGGVPGNTPQAVSPQPAVAQQIPPQGGVSTPERKQIIPNIQGGGTSPARKVPKSLDDLRKLARQAS